MSKFDKHIGKGEPIEINGEEFILKPLTTEFIPDFFLAMKAFSGAKDGASIEETLRNIDDQGLKAIQRIVEATLRKSYPGESDESRNLFGMKYVMNLFPKIIEINSAEPTDIETIKKARVIEKINEKQRSATKTEE